MAKTSKLHASAGPIGGASGDAGVEYRRAVAAYAISHGLAGESLPGFGFPLPAAVVTAVSIETDEQIDDVLVTFTSGRRSMIQAKRDLKLGSNFTKACAQWAAAAQEGVDPKLTRFVIVGGKGSKSIQTLAAVLDRCKSEMVGAHTDKEAEAIRRLRQDLGDVSDSEFDLILKCGVIRILDVEEEGSPGASSARAVLRHVLLDGSDLVEAWRTLLVVAGQIARQRGGFTIRGWVELLSANGVTFSGAPSPAAEQSRQLQAMDSYRDHLRRRGTMIDLRPLGADCGPIPLIEMDASVSCRAAGDGDRDSEKLLWSLIRRRRVVLTGLPGGGKSIALAAAAAEMLDVPDLPLPLVVPLKKVINTVDGSFEDRVLGSAVEDLPEQHRAAVRRELECGLRDGGTAVLFDGLDETHERRGEVVAAIAEFVDQVDEGVSILLTTRTVAYAQAASLGWDAMELSSPARPEDSVSSVLNAVARARSTEDPQAWVAKRLEWVNDAMRQDPALRETPLMPVLLSLLAADRNERLLPSSRAKILHETVEATVRRRESQRERSTVPGLDKASGIAALMDAFLIEASLLADSSKGVSLADANTAIAGHLRTNWGLAPGAAKVAASATTRFWDELGVFVVMTYDDQVQARIEILLDIGDALAIESKTPSVVRAWVRKRVAQRRLEPLILAAAISDEAADEFAAECEREDDHAVVSAVLSALAQTGRFSAEAHSRIVLAARRDIERVDRQGWETFATLSSSGKGVNRSGELLLSLADYPANHRLAARVAVAGADNANEPPTRDEAAAVLAIRGLDKLNDRDGYRPASGISAWLGRDLIFAKAIRAAARLLVSLGDDGARLVAAAVRDDRTRKVNRDLEEVLRVAGYEHLIPAETPMDPTLLKGPMELINRLRESDPIKLLGDLCSRSKSYKLTRAEAARLDVLAKLYTTLNLEYPSGWPGPERYDEWINFVDAVVSVAGVDRARLNAEIEVMISRLSNPEDRSAFYAMGIASDDLILDKWGDLEDLSHYVVRLATGLYLNRDAAFVAASGLARAPDSIAVDVLREAVSHLDGFHHHQHVAAFALVFQLGHEVPTEWHRSDSPALRLVDVQLGPATLDTGMVDPRVARALRDCDREVGRDAARAIAKSEAQNAADVLRGFSSSEPSDWVCRECSIEVSGPLSSCPKCHIVADDPRGLARELLATIDQGLG